jgi:hypothetical protein
MGSVMAYDYAREHVVLFGGRMSDTGGRYSETWLYSPVNPAAVSVFGTGCGAGSSVPDLTPLGRPWIGDSLDFRLSNLRSTPTLTALGLGWSRTAWGTVPLPASLSVIGLGTCTLYISLDAVVAQVSAGSEVRYGLLPVPPSSNLVGASFFAQGFALDPPANPVGVSATPAVEARIGAR